MKIRTALNIVIVVLFIIFAVFVSVLTFSFQRMSIARQQSQLATAIAVDASRFRSLALEYLLNPSERVGRQMYRQYEVVGAQLNHVVANSGTDTSELEGDFLALEREFAELIAVHEEEDNVLNVELRDLLGQQVSVASQRIVSGLLEISAVHEIHVRDALRLAYFTVFIASLGAFILVLVIFGLFKNKVVRPILRMESDMRLITAGDLGHKVADGRGDEIGKLAQSINAMVSKLKELDDLKSTFINTAAHQLRTPMTNIRWTTEGMLASLPKTQTNVRKKIESIHENVIKMVTAVKDLLDVTSIQR